MREHIGVSKVIISLVSATGMSSDRECSIEGETALVVGADRMGPLAVRAVTEWADHVIVATRTLPHDEYVADSIEVETTAVGLDGLEPAVAEASVVVSATGSNTQVSDVDSSESLTDKTQSTRRRTARDGERLVDSEFDHLLTQYKRKRAERVISAIHETAERVKTAEVDTAMAKGEFDESQREAVESMADTIVSQLLAAPTESLRDAAEKGDWSTIQTAVELFDLDCCSEQLEFVQPMGIDALPRGIRDQLQPAVLEQLVED
jgi:glutamyl-tRNA reductase